MGTRRPNAIALQRPTLLLVLAFSLLLASCGGGVGAASGAQAQRTQGLSIGPSSLPDAVAGNAYSASLSATGNSGSVTWSITSGSLPSGLSLDSSTGLISGTPTTVTVPGSASFTVQATDATGAKLSEPLSIRVAAVLAITTTSLPAQGVGVAYNQTVKVTGGIAPYALSAADALIVPIQAEYFALEGLGQLTHVIDLVKQHLHPKLNILGVLITMFDARTNLALQVVQEVDKFFPGLMFESRIPRTVRLSEAPSYGTPIAAFDPKGKGAAAYSKLATEVLARE